MLFRSVVVTALLLLAGYAPQAAAQSFPSRSVRLVVGYEPGGSIDALARIVAHCLAEKYPSGAVVENRAGADSVIAANVVAHASPDGYTLFVASNALASTASQKDLGYDPVESFTPILLAVSVPNVLVVNQTMSSVNSLQDLVALAKTKPGTLNYGSPGVSSPATMEMTWLNQQAGIDLVNITYKGIAPAMTGLLGGSTDVMFASVTSAIPLIESGKLKPLAISTTRRSPLLPQVPTVAESLNIAFDEAGTWVGLLAPAGTPDNIIGQLRQDVVVLLNEPQTVELLRKQGFATIAAGGSEFKEFIRLEISKSAQLAKVVNK